MKIGFDKNKVTCFKCKQNGHFKRECSNNKADDNDNRCILHNDEVYDWSKHDKEVGEVKVMVAEIKQSREERYADMRLDDVYDAYKEATGVNKWSEKKECFVDPNGNLTIDPNKVDFEALVAAIPTIGVWCKGLEEIPRYREKVEEGIKKVIYASLEKKKTIEEILDESEKLVKEVKNEEVVDEKQQMEKADEKAEEAVVENQQIMEDQKLMIENATVYNAEVIIKIDSSYSSIKIDNIAEQQCKKCMETCKSCTEKDDCYGWFSEPIS
ncbi:putative transcription factor interactor and regulator CCHC(Zn) family [Helianthus anomalus]